MNCQYCQTQNPDEAKFCMNCGKSIKIICNQCSKENPPQAKFCINCGSELIKSSNLQEDPIHRFIPKAYAEKLEIARKSQTMKGERRIVTILFCDVKGSTAMAEKLDPEEWAEIINQAFEYLISPIYKYEGTLARLMGDAVLAFFGAPIAHEDDAQRAVLAGLDIINGIKPFRDEIKNRYGLDFNIRVGINTGLVVVGGVGSDLFMEYTALGDAINIAARMEQTAKPGTLQIAEDTYKKVAYFFETEFIEDVEIKGKTDSIEVYRVLQARETPASQRGIKGIDAPMIGRAGEIDRLSRILDEVKRGRGQIVSLIGEAGLGKSRLLREVQENWKAMDLGVDAFGKIESRWNQIFGISYESTRPYGLIQQLVRNFVGLTPSDSLEIIRETLSDTFRSAGVEIPTSTLGLFETILGVKEHTNENQLEGEDLKKAIYRELLSTLDYLVQQGPTVIAIDDLHWVDQTSAEFIVHLFQLTDRLPILFICAFRPDHTSPAWMIKQAAEKDYNHRYTEINLSPLSSNESNALVNALFTSDEIPLDVRRMILEKSDGNPFFMEEVIRTLIDNDIVTQNRDNSHLIVTSRIDNFTIPDNLHALLAARIDRLEENAKHVLQLASVIGRSFNQPVLEIICDDKSELDYELNNLQRLDLILEYAREPYIEYIFRQALTQETVYNTILLKYRREFHKRVGEALLQLYPDRVDEYVSVLGYHFYQAQDPRASIYFRRAGDSAFRLYANAEAIGYYSKAIETTMWVEHPDLDQLVYLYGRRGRSFELNSQFSEALGNYKDMEELAQKYQVISVELNAIIAQAQIYSVPSTEFNLLTGLELIEKAKAMAKALNDQAALAKIYWIMTNLYRFHRSLDKAQQMGEKAIALARKLGLEEQLAYSLTDSAHTYNLNGQVVRAREVSLEAAELWRKMGNQPMLADCLGGLASIHVFSGEYDQAYAYSNEAYEISSKIDNIWGKSYSRYAIGFVDMERGNVDLAIRNFEQSIKDAREANFLVGEILTNGWLSIMYSLYGDYQQAEDTISRMFAEQPKNVELIKPFFLGAQLLSLVLAGKVNEADELIKKEESTSEQMSFYAVNFHQLALCHLAYVRQDYQAATKNAKDFLDTLKIKGIEFLTPELLLLISKAQISLALWEDAENTLGDAQIAVEKLGSRRSQWQVEYLLGQCAIQRGDLNQAGEYFHRSKKTIAYILDHIASDDLKGHFLNLEAVRQVFDVAVETS